jgi:hypothetical protein
VRVLLWHVHGSWTNAFVRGDHEYLLPFVPDRGPDGRGRARTWEWPATVRELSPAGLRDAEFDVMVLQRPHELDLARRWTGRRPGLDVAAVYVEHNTPAAPCEPHPLADQRSIPIVHVTHFNQLMWDSGSAPRRVVEHGVPDPGYAYTGEIRRVAAVVNEPARRGWPVGADLLPTLGVPIDLFGMGVNALAGGRVRAFEDLPQRRLHDQLARRAVYLHPYRWTSLGLALIEAMMLGLPVVALDVTESSRAVPATAGRLTNDLDELGALAAALLADPDRSRAMGLAAREAALARYGLHRFLADWDDLLAQTVHVHSPALRP